MEEKFLIGVILGMLGGALVATNSVKARQIIKDGQQSIKDTVSTKKKKNGQSETK